MKHKNLSSVLGFAVPLVLVAALILGWRMPVRGVHGSEMLYFVITVAMGYPVLAAFCGAMGALSNSVLKWLSIPFMAGLGMALAHGMRLSAVTGLIFGFWGAVVALIGLLFALRMRAEGRW